MQRKMIGSSLAYGLVVAVGKWPFLQRLSAASSLHHALAGTMPVVSCRICLDAWLQNPRFVLLLFLGICLLVTLIQKF